MELRVTMPVVTRPIGGKVLYHLVVTQLLGCNLSPRPGPVACQQRNYKNHLSWGCSCIKCCILVSSHSTLIQN